MKIIEPAVELIDEIKPAQILEKLERCGRVCYQSEPKGQPEEFIRARIKAGHESILEHVSLTFHIVCDRAIMSELTRHRLASFSVESTRFCKYDELAFVNPPPDSAMEQVEAEYIWQLNNGVRPELARAVLPLSLKSELYMTANLREWRHILKLRTTKDAHPQMRFVAGQILSILRDKLPVIVEDIKC